MFLGENTPAGQSHHHRLHGLPAGDGSEQELGPGDGRGDDLRRGHPPTEPQWSQTKMRFFLHSVILGPHTQILVKTD